jgi:hypothetical protein
VVVDRERRAPVGSVAVPAVDAVGAEAGVLVEVLEVDALVL